MSQSPVGMMQSIPDFRMVVRLANSQSQKVNGKRMSSLYDINSAPLLLWNSWTHWTPALQIFFFGSFFSDMDKEDTSPQSWLLHQSEQSHYDTIMSYIAFAIYHMWCTVYHWTTILKSTVANDIKFKTRIDIEFLYMQLGNQCNFEEKLCHNLINQEHERNCFFLAVGINPPLPVATLMPNCLLNCCVTNGTANYVGQLSLHFQEGFH